MENLILWVMLCVSQEGGAVGSWLPSSRWSRMPSFKVSDLEAGVGGVAGVGGGGQGADAILDLDVCAV